MPSQWTLETIPDCAFIIHFLGDSFKQNGWLNPQGPSGCEDVALETGGQQNIFMFLPKFNVIKGGLSLLSGSKISLFSSIPAWHPIYCWRVGLADDHLVLLSGRVSAP